MPAETFTMGWTSAGMQPAQTGAVRRASIEIAFPTAGEPAPTIGQIWPRGRD